MKLGKFKDLAEKRFSQEKIAEMKREVALEADALMQQKKKQQKIALSL
jgi:hypothetical protein